MDTLLAAANFAIIILPPLAIGLAIRAVAGSDDVPDSLPGFLKPIVASAPWDETRRPVVREEEPVRWNLAPLGPATVG